MFSFNQSDSKDNDIVTEPGSFGPRHSKPKRWDPEVSSKESFFARQPSEKMEEQISSPPTRRQGAQGIYEIQNKKNRAVWAVGSVGNMGKGDWKKVR